MDIENLVDREVRQRLWDTEGVVYHERRREDKRDPRWDDQYDSCHAQKDEGEVAEWEETKERLEEEIKELEEKLNKQEERLEKLKQAQYVRDLDLKMPLRLIEITEEKLEEAESNLEEHIKAKEELPECDYYTYWLISEWLYRQLGATLENPPLLQVHSLHIIVSQGGSDARNCHVLKSYVEHVSSS
tara:strand:- start:404 stop:964 length:561 start_codon:yes stop_codon:yes gene_type:complete